MGRKIQFIHTADIHLGAPFRGVRSLPDQWARRLLSSIPDAYDRVVTEAIRRHVDFVIIAGDVFDTARPSYGDYMHFFDGLRQLDNAGIPVYMCTGNHDPFTSWQRDFDRFPDNTTMFSADKPSYALYRRDGEPLCMLGGRSYFNQTWPLDENIAEGLDVDSMRTALAAREPDAAQAPFSVGVIHTGLTFDKVKSPADPDALIALGVDYWACGHIHKRFVYPSNDNPRVVFPGCIQGRDINETGERSCSLVTLEEGKPNRIEPIYTANIVWQRPEVSVTSCQTLLEVEELVNREMFKLNGKAHCESMIIRVTLRGETPLHELIARPDVRESMRKRMNDTYPEFYYDEIVDGTSAPRDIEALRREGMFPAVLLRMADEQRADYNDAIAYVQEEFVKRGLHLPDSLGCCFDELEQRAENIALDLLEQNSE